MVVARGTNSNAWSHVTDWFPTVLGLAGGDASPTATGPIDGVDVWQVSVILTFVLIVTSSSPHLVTGTG